MLGVLGHGGNYGAQQFLATWDMLSWVPLGWIIQINNSCQLFRVPLPRGTTDMPAPEVLDPVMGTPLFYIIPFFFWKHIKASKFLGISRTPMGRTMFGILFLIYDASVRKPTGLSWKWTLTWHFSWNFMWEGAVFIILSDAHVATDRTATSRLEAESWGGSSLGQLVSFMPAS